MAFENITNLSIASQPIFLATSRLIFWLRAVGIIILIYIIYYVVSTYYSYKRNKRIIRIERKLDKVLDELHHNKKKHKKK